MVLQQTRLAKFSTFRQAGHMLFDDTYRYWEQSCTMKKGSHLKLGYVVAKGCYYNHSITACRTVPTFLVANLYFPE